MFHIWTLSLEGNQATKLQAVALAEAVRDNLGDLNVGERIVTSHFIKPPEGFDITKNTGVTWDRALEQAELTKLGLEPPWPDLIVSCRPEVAAVALGIKKASGCKTQIVHIQDPAGRGRYALPRQDFDLIVAQPQENMDGFNMITPAYALHPLTPKMLQEIRTADSAFFQPLPVTIRQPLIAVLVGGSDEYVQLAGKDYEDLSRDLRKLAETHDGTIAVITSRRTGEGKNILKRGLEGVQNIQIDPQGLTYIGALAWADKIVTTADSLSMGSESGVEGKPLSLYNFQAVLNKHPLAKEFRRWVEQGTAAYFPEFSQHNPAYSTSDVAGDVARLVRTRVCPRNAL